MELQVLMATMHQEDTSLIKKANIRSNSIIANQHDKFDYKIVKEYNRAHHFYSFAERGVGLNRNNALIRATKPICLIGDDDIVYVDNMEQIVLNEFSKTTADVIIFDIDIIEKDVVRKKIKKDHNVNYFNYMKHGGPKIAFRTESVLKAGINFSLYFGGGAKYGSGEDSLFLKSCLDNQLKVVYRSKNIGTVYNDGSSWFNGYNEKYLFDRGALFKAMSKKLYIVYILQFVIRRKKLFGNFSYSFMIKKMLEGARSF
jgi:hypothetical protein